MHPRVLRARTKLVLVVSLPLVFTIQAAMTARPTGALEVTEATTVDAKSASRLAIDPLDFFGVPTPPRRSAPAQAPAVPAAPAVPPAAVAVPPEPVVVPPPPAS